MAEKTLSQKQDRLFNACIANDLSEAKVLIKSRADINGKTETQHTALRMAIYCGHIDIAKLILNTKSLNIDSRDSAGATVLTWAIRNNQIDILNLAIEKGADIDSQSIANNTPLIEACYEGNIEAVEILLAKKADITTKNNDNKNATEIAEGLNHYEISTLLDHVIFDDDFDFSKLTD